MAATAKVSSLPKCDMCTHDARFDAAMVVGPWGYFCPSHWMLLTTRRLGTGLGQLLYTDETDMMASCAENLSASEFLAVVRENRDA